MALAREVGDCSTLGLQGVTVICAPDDETAQRAEWAANAAAKTTPRTLPAIKADLGKLSTVQFAKLQTAAIAWALAQNDPNTHDRANRAASDHPTALVLVGQWLMAVPAGAVSLGVHVLGVQ